MSKFVPSYRFALSALVAFLSILPVPSTGAEFPGISNAEAALTREIFTDVDEERWSAAEALGQRAQDPVLGKLVRWLDLLRPQAGHNFAEINDFIEANPDWPRQRGLVLRAEDVMDGVPAPQLRDWFARHQPISPLAQLRDADLIAAAGNAEDARARIESAWINGNFTDTDFQNVLSKYGSMLTTADHISRTDRLLWAGEGEQAMHMLRLLPSGWRYLTIARLKLSAGARGADAALAQVPASLRNNGGLLYDRLRWCLSNGDQDGAIAIMDTATDDLGRPDRWWPYRQILARDLISRSEYEHAYRLASDHSLVDGVDAAEAEFLTGWIALRFMQRPDLAYTHFVRLHDISTRPVSVARGAYWAGRAAEAKGDSQSAKTWYTTAALYPTTFYGQLAAAVPGIPAPPRPEPEPVNSADDTAAFDSQELVRAIFILSAAGEDDLVKTFFVSLANRPPTVEYEVLLADLAAQIGRPDLGVTVAKIASYANISMLRAGYPLVRMPRNAGAEQALLLAITRQESAFDISAVSPTGARGLMQLEPGTASHTARELGLPYSLNKLTANGFYNVTLGQAYLDDLLSRFNGSYLLAIAAYNAGPARVSQWIDQFGDPRVPGSDTIDWIEKIPFGETRDYVQRVFENLQVYRLRIGRRDLAFSLARDLTR